MELSTRLCPLCHVPFLQIPVGDGSIEICEKCQGTFFEFDELWSVLKSPVKEKFREIAYGDGKPDRRGSISCPKCGSVMKEKEYATSKIHMDQCWKCSSIFLDSEEHEAINRYLTSLESPDVAKAEEEKFEKLYQEKLVEMAEKMLAEMNGSR